MIFINPYLNASAPIADSRFIFTVNTQNLSTGSTALGIFRLPLTSASTINATVDWGDNTSDLITVWNQAQTTHTYTTGGVYEIKISGVINGFAFSDTNDKLKILNISNWGTFNLSLTATFNGCSNLTSNAIDAPLITTFSLVQTFRNCTVFNGNISNWNVSSANNFSGIFSNASAFNQNISSWNTANVTNMFFAFFGATSFNQNLSNWNIANVTNFGFFMNSVTLSTSNYDALLIGWSSQIARNNISVNFGSSRYTLNGAAETARNVLINTYNWTISDGGGI
jgi:surface protein